MNVTHEAPTPTISIESYRSVREAASLMARHDVDQISVVNGSWVCGVYTSRELVADVAAGADLDGTPIAFALKRQR